MQKYVIHRTINKSVMQCHITNIYFAIIIDALKSDNTTLIVAFI